MKNKFKLVCVTWEDSAKPISNWQWIADYDNPEIVECLSVGYLIADTKTALSLAPNIGGINGDKSQACGIIRIPRSAIKKVKIISF